MIDKCSKNLFSDYIIRIFLIVYIFCFIYAPRFYSFNTIHILAIIAIFVFPLIINDIIEVGRKAITIRFCFFYLLILGWSTVIAFLGKERLPLNNLVVVPFELCICILFILGVMKRRRMSAMSLLNYVMIAGIIQSLICCAMVLLPDFRNMINEFRAQYWDDRMIGWAAIRLLGFADGLLHTTPIIQAIISILLIKKSEKTTSFVFIFVLTTLFSAILNSRTSFVVWVAGVVYYLLSDASTSIGKKKLIAFFGCCMIFVPYVMLVLLEGNAGEAIEYFYSGMEEINSAAQGQKVGFFSYLDKYFRFPDGLDFIFGIGCDTYGSVNRPEYRTLHTDYGFVNDVWSYGAVGAFFMIIIYLQAIFRCRYLGNNYSKLVTWCLLVAFFIGHFKGILTIYNDYTAFLLLISSSTVLDYYKKINIVSQDTILNRNI